MTFLTTAFVTFVVAWIAIPALVGFAKLFCLVATVEEREAQVFVLFGKVIGVVSEPGLHFLPLKIGPQSVLIRFFGQVRKVDLRLDQQYLRSQPVNSEEGTPMGVGVWYEMAISDPEAFLFRNTDPRGSLSANVSNATVRCLSNMPLERLLQDRHAMSRLVRAEVSPKSEAWGFRLGSVYIRKVHFRDVQMIEQIAQKVINRLRQVTSAIRQDGANQVAVIRSGAEKIAATEFARAQAIRPALVGQAIQEISEDPEIAEAVFEILETARMLDGDTDITLVPQNGGNLLASLLAAKSEPTPPTV